MESRGVTKQQKVLMPKTSKTKDTPNAQPIKQHNWPAPKLLLQADSLFDKFEFEASLNFAERALTCCGDVLEERTRAYQLITACLLEMGELDRVREQFVIMLPQVEGEAKVEALFSLGQLSEGKEALSFYLQGIQESANNHFISNAWSSIAELYMTDLCEEEEAEEACENAISRALEYGSVEAHRVAAELRLVQGRQEEARKHATSLIDTTTDTSYDARRAIVKIFIELQMYPEAITFAETLLQEDDEVLDVWYLSALACQQAEMPDQCSDAFEGGLGLIERLKQACIEYDTEIETELLRMKDSISIDDENTIDTLAMEKQECSSDMDDSQ